MPTYKPCYLVARSCSPESSPQPVTEAWTSPALVAQLGGGRHPWGGVPTQEE